MTVCKLLLLKESIFILFSSSVQIFSYPSQLTNIVAIIAPSSHKNRTGIRAVIMRNVYYFNSDMQNL